MGFFGSIQTVIACPVPADSLLAPYETGQAQYADSYCTEVAARISLESFVTGFYCTWLFKIERWILKYLAGRPSTDDEVSGLANGKTEHFAAWSVEARTSADILLADFSGKTRSWLMVMHHNNGTRLYFGSAVLSRTTPDGQRMPPSVIFSILSGFHRVYSIALLTACREYLLARESVELDQD